MVQTPLTQTFAHRGWLVRNIGDDSMIGSVEGRVDGQECVQCAALMPVTNGDSDPSLTTRTSCSPARRSAAMIMDGLADVSWCCSERSSRAAQLA